MQPATETKVILITRRTRLEDLAARFNTVSQARFYVEHLGADFEDYVREDKTYRDALTEATATLSRLGRVHVMERTFLPNYVFGPQDIIVTLGQDGLVANTLKYLHGQPVLGVNPDPARWDGQLLPFRVADLTKVLPEVFARRRPIKEVKMARAALNDGQSLLAVNDLFIGVRNHSSARYIIESGGRREQHSSSGVIISTGLGSTGWLKSLLNGAAGIVRGLAHDRGVQADPVQQFATPPDQRAGQKRGQQRGKKGRGPQAAPLVETTFAWDAPHLYFTVREPFPSSTTGAELVFGRVSAQQPLRFESLMAEGGVIFSDGIDKDFLNFNSGTKADVTIADKTGHLVV